MINIKFIGTDGWGRLVFKGDNGRFYKTVELCPREGFDRLAPEEKLELMHSLHSSDGPNGEPDFPCWSEEKFTLVN